MCVCVWLDLHIWSTLPYLIRNRFGKMGNYCLSCGCLLFTYQINWSDMTDSWTVRRKNKRKLEITVWKFVFQTERLFASKIRAWVEMTKRERASEKVRRCAEQQQNGMSRREKKHSTSNGTFFNMSTVFLLKYYAPCTTLCKQRDIL